MKYLILILLISTAIISCDDYDASIIEKNHTEKFMSVDKIPVSSSISNEISYTLEEYINLSHSEYGTNFINQHLYSIIDNISNIDENIIDEVISAKPYIKFRWKWDECSKLGACLIIRFSSFTDDDSNLSDVYAGINGNKLIVIPQTINNGMLSDGYIFVDPIQINKDEAEYLGISEGKKIRPGIYKCQLPTAKYPYGYHVFDIID
jgi:hypothetical protein